MIPVTRSLPQLGIVNVWRDNLYKKGFLNLPFLAFLRGKQTFSELNEEMKWSNAAIAVILASGLALRKLKKAI